MKDDLHYIKLTSPSGAPVYVSSLQPPHRIMPEGGHTLLMWGGDRQLVMEPLSEMLTKWARQSSV